MSRFNVLQRVRRRTAQGALLVPACLVAVTLTGCSSGQIAQTSVQEPAVDGAAGQIGQLALRNVYIRATQTSDFIRPGQTVELVLVASNQSQDTTDRLVRITSDIGAVTLTGDTGLAAGGVLMVNTAGAADIKSVDAVEPADGAKATVALNKPISNGLTYPFTFDFERAGSVTFPVPIAADQGTLQQQPEQRR